MRPVDIIPECIFGYFKKSLLRLKNPSCIIKTHMISRKSRLGFKSAVLRNVELYGESYLGDYSYVNANSIVCDTVIGKFSSVGYNCIIGANEHPTDYVSTSPHLYAKGNILGMEQFFDDNGKRTFVGNDCWIGSNCIIIKGVNVGNGAVIGAGSVVTKDVEPFSITLGAPARKLKMRFEEDKIQFLEKLKWWDMSESSILKYKDAFSGKEKWFDNIQHSYHLFDDQR